MTERIMELTRTMDDQERAIDRLPACPARDTIEVSYDRNLRLWDEVITEYFLTNPQGCCLRLKGTCEKELKGYYPCMECFYDLQDDMKITVSQIRALRTLQSMKLLDENKYRDWLHKCFGKRHTKELTKAEASQAINLLQGQPTLPDIREN